jgi:hypothetical protein
VLVLVMKTLFHRMEEILTHCPLSLMILMSSMLRMRVYLLLLAMLHQLNLLMVILYSWLLTIAQCITWRMLLLWMRRTC